MKPVVSRGARGAGVVALLALVVLALNLRSPITSLPPVINDIRSDLGIGPAMAGLLTTIPVLCFGVLTPAASLFIARTSVDRAVFATLGGLILGLIIRSSGGLTAVLAGTVVIGAALTIGNIVSLMVIARDFPRRLHVVTGIYASGLNVGSMLSSGLTAPLAVVLGWRGAIGAWAVLALLAMALWGFATRRRGGGGSEARPGVARSGAVATLLAAPLTLLPVWRRPLVWLLVVAFTAHLFIYYGLTAWLPAFLIQTDGMATTQAGFVASLFQVLALLGSFGVPALAGRVSGAALLVGIALAWLVTCVGFLAMPGQWVLWSITGGIATGGGFTTVFTLAMGYAHDLNDNRRISAVVQGLGYAIASVGPLLIGVLHQATGDWHLSFSLLASGAALIALAGIGVARADR